MAEPTVLGMPIDAEPDDLIRTAQPVAALVTVKVLFDDGEIGYLTRATDGLMSVEAVGMARYAQLRLERALVKGIEGEREA